MSRRPVVGYYAHHHGRGHLTRAAAILGALDAEATVLSTGSYVGPGASIVLKDDAIEPGPHTRETAGGVLHWAPLRSAGLRDRMTAIASWIDAARPDAFVVDVSVEVAMLARLCGVPTVVMAMPGERGDEPHQLGYAAADAIIASWPQALYEPSWLGAHTDRTTYVGGISRFEHRSTLTRPASTERTVVVLGSRGGAGFSESDIDAARAATPGWRWVPIGTPGAVWAEDPWDLLCSADVIVSAAGQSSIADLAVLGKPAIVLCEPRPYDEQLATGRSLRDGGLATVLEKWPEPARWPALIAGATAGRWGAWATAGAARRAAAVIERLTS